MCSHEFLQFRTKSSEVKKQMYTAHVCVVNVYTYFLVNLTKLDDCLNTNKVHSVFWSAFVYNTEVCLTNISRDNTIISLEQEMDSE